MATSGAKGRKRGSDLIGSAARNQEPGRLGAASVVLTMRGETEQQVTSRLDEAVERIMP